MSALPSLIQDLLQPEAYPHRPKHIDLVQTHISYVLLADDLVYKIKKPVNFGFLDFTTLEKRLFYCRRELELNRRLAEEIYLDVVPIVKRQDKYVLEAEGVPVEWAVKMKRLPEEGMMQRLIDQGLLQERHMELLVQKLVPFYQKAATGAEVNKYGSIETISYNVEENFTQTRDFVGLVLSPWRYKHIVTWTRKFLETQQALFAQRVTEGFIRDGHGDLYSANICFDEPHNKVYIFDCIEFNDRFRCGDVAQDLAFLAMDLDFHRLDHLAEFFIRRYTALAKDQGLYDLLDFYKCYRAYVRGKIGCFTWSAKEVAEEVRQKSLSQARRYFDLAYRYAQGLPVLLVFFGLSGSGKSTLARRIAQKLLATYYNSDVVRKEILGLDPKEHHYEPFGQGIYRPDITQKTYQTLVERALAHLAEGQDVVLDATFLSKTLRSMVLEHVKSMPIKRLFVWCKAPEEVVKERLSKRKHLVHEPSDGRWEIYLAQKERFEPPEEIPPEELFILDTNAPPEELEAQILERLWGDM